MVSVNPTTLVEKAKIFATHAHVGQIRRHTCEPYVRHCERVARLVELNARSTPEMIAAAWLHDTVEDTKTTHADIRREFGDTVFEYVFWLTDVARKEDGNRELRTYLNRIHVTGGPFAVQLIKCADMIDNTTSIVEHQPDFAKVYLREKDALLTLMAQCHAQPRYVAIEGHPLWLDAKDLVEKHAHLWRK